MSAHKSFNVPIKGGVLPLGPHPLIMGILNTTPDSFSDGGEFTSPQHALEQTQKMLAQGADIIDVGGQSTRPEAQEISTAKEANRVIPIIEHLRANGVKEPISIDTFKSEIAQRAIDAGAVIINDVTGLRRDPAIAEVAAQNQTPLIIMHWDKQLDAKKDLIDQLKQFFGISVATALKAGVSEQAIILDPGFGFGKNLAQNYEILNRVGALADLGFPLLIGTSRKSMLGKLLDIPAKQRASATAATSTIAYLNGAQMFRVHDVAENYQALQVAKATCYGVFEPEETI